MMKKNYIILKNIFDIFVFVNYVKYIYTHIHTHIHIRTYIYKKSLDD